MERETVISSAREELAERVRSRPIPPPSPLACSPWIAMSLMQKAIRRGHEDLALGAASTLLRDSPERLWRRSGIIAFEDIGFADLTIVAQVVAALGGQAFRAKLGGEWAVTSAIVSMMARAPKCRAADDLAMIVYRHPALAEARQDYAALSTRELLGIATGSECLPKRALALCYAVGTARRPSNYLRLRAGDPRAVFDYLLEAGFAAGAVEIAREGYRRIGELLCPIVLQFTALLPPKPHEFINDALPPERTISDVPSWAFDMFTREGRSAIKRFLARDSATRRWMRKHVPGDKRVAFLGDLVFAVEGGLLRTRLNWSLAEVLRDCAEQKCQGPWCPDATEIIALVRADLPLLNEVRAHVR